MLVSDFVLTESHGVLRVQAHVAWEGRERPPLSVFVETEPRHRDAISPDPNAFLLACLLPAWHAEEKRVHIVGPLCPVLTQNLKAAVAILYHWWPEDFGLPPRVDGTLGFEVRQPADGGAICMFSGGIDSLATLRWNRLHVPTEHPASIRALMFVEHFRTPSESADSFGRRIGGRLPVVRRVARAADVDVVPVVTNAWWLVDRHGYFYDQKWHGALLSACGSLFAHRFSRIYIGSSFDADDLKPYGSHPLTDALCSSAHVQVEHDGETMSRLEKTALVASWPDGLNNIRVCQNDETGAANCGTCEKCIRTMTALTALGRLAECEAFEDWLSPEVLARVHGEYGRIRGPWMSACYREMIPLLSEVGRPDLAEVIERFPVVPARAGQRPTRILGLRARP